MQVSDEIQEYKDDETGSRVRRLTGDGSDNVHLYFTSESFLAGPANRLVFASNRSGRFQFHLLDIEAAKLVQVTDGKVTPEHTSSVSTTQKGRRQGNFLAAHV